MDYLPIILVLIRRRNQSFKHLFLIIDDSKHQPWKFSLTLCTTAMFDRFHFPKFSSCYNSCRNLDSQRLSGARRNFHVQSRNGSDRFINQYWVFMRQYFCPIARSWKNCSNALKKNEKRRRPKSKLTSESQFRIFRTKKFRRFWTNASRTSRRKISKHEHSVTFLADLAMDSSPIWSGCRLKMTEWIRPMMTSSDR